MAKSPNGLGQFSGKLGGVVYAVRGGEQIVRAYQPVVNNPKSTSQMLQRAKGNVVGRLSAITPREVIFGLGSNNIRRRSRFLQLALRNAKARFDGTDYVGSLPEDLLILSEGSFSAPFSFILASISGNTLTATIDRFSGISEADYNTMGITLVVYGIDPVSGAYDYVVYTPVTLPAWGSGGAASFTQQIVLPKVSGHTFAAYIIPFRTNPSAAATISRDLYSDADEFAAALALSQANGNFIYAKSQYINPTTANQ